MNVICGKKEVRNEYKASIAKKNNSYIKQELRSGKDFITGGRQRHEIQ